MRPAGNIDEVLTPEAPRPPEVTRQGRVVTYKWTTSGASGGHTIEVVFYRQGDDIWEVSSLVDGSVWADRSPKGQGIGLEFLRAEANALRHFLTSTRPRAVFADVVRHGVEERGMRRNSRVRAQSRVLQRVADETGYVFSRGGAALRDEGGVRLQLSMPEGAAVNEALVQPAGDAQTARGLTPESASVLADIYTRVDQPAFDKWLRDFAEVKDAKSEQDARHHFYSYLNDWLYEKYNVSVRTDGLIEFWQLSPRLVSILGDNRVVLYHVTGEKILPQIRKLGLLPATSKRTRTDAMYSTGAGVYLSSVSSGNQMNTYASNARTRFGDYVMLTVRVSPQDLAPDPDDADIASGRTQFIVDHVPPEDVIDWGVPRESLTEREADPKRVRLIRRIVSHIRQRFLDLAKLAETDPAAADAQLHVPSDIAALNVKAAGGSWGIEFGHRELHTPELAKYGIHAVAIAPYNSADGSGPQASYIPTGDAPYIRLHTNLDRNSPITARRIAGPFLSGERRYLDSLVHEVAHALDFSSRENKADDSFVARRIRGGVSGYYNSEHEVHAYVTQALKAFMDFVQMAEDWTLRAITRETTKTLDDVRNSQIGVPQLQHAMQATASVATFIDGVLHAKYVGSEKTHPLDKFANSMTAETRKRVRKRIATFYPTARTAVRRAVDHVEKAATARFGAVSESALVEHLPLDGEEVWRIPQREFLRKSITGHIGSRAYENYEKDGGLSWVPLSKYTEPLGSIDTANGVVEFRGEAGLRRYAKRDPNDEFDWLRDDKGDIVYMSQDEIRAQGFTEKNPCVAAVHAERVVGFASDEFGVPGIWVERAWQRKGIGMRLLELLSTRMKIKKMGQATPAGVEMSAKYHKLLVKQALRRGEPVPPEVLADYPDLVKTESILNERYTSNLARLWRHFERDKADPGAKALQAVLAEFEGPRKRILLDRAGIEPEKLLDDAETDALLVREWPKVYDFLVNDDTGWLARVRSAMTSQFGTINYLDAESAELLPPDTWLVHFTDAADAIVTQGFQFAAPADDVSGLGLTKTPFADQEDSRGGTFGFAFRADGEEPQEGPDAAASDAKYGKHAVVFRAAGIRIWHRHDAEWQVIFDASAIRPDALIRMQRDGDEWLVPGVRGLRGDFRKVLDWVIAHRGQYRRALSTGYARDGRWVGRPKRIERVNEASGSTSSYYDPGAEYVHYSSADFESFRRHGRNGQDAGAVFLVRADDEAAVQYASLYGKPEVLADYPDLVKTESRLDERYTSNLAALWGKFKDTRDKGEETLRWQVVQLGQPYMYMMLDHMGVDYNAEISTGRARGLDGKALREFVLAAHWPAVLEYLRSNDDEAKSWMHRILRDHPAEGAFSVFDAETATLLPPSTWLVHFTNHAEAIRYEGFQRGPRVGAWGDLGFTPLADPKSMEGGTFAFALEVESARTAEVAAGREYGRECVIFQAAGVRVYHRTDQEEQVIFDGSAVRPDSLVVLHSDGDDWYVRQVPKIRGTFEKVAAWVVAHAQQYRRRLSNGYWQGRWFGRPKRKELVSESAATSSSYYDPNVEYAHFSNADFDALRRHGKHGRDAGALFLVRADDEAAVQYASLYGKTEYRARVHLSPDQVFDLSNPTHVERVLAVAGDMTEEGDTGEDFLRGAKHHASGLDWATINGDVLMAAGFAAAVVGERPAGAHNPVTGQGYTHDVRSLAVFDPSVLALQSRKRVNEVLDVAGARPAIEWKYGGGMAKYTTTVDVGGVSYAVGVGFLRKTAAVWDLEYYVNDKVQASSVAKGAVFPILSFVHAAVRQFISDTRPREIHVYAYPHGEHDAKNMREQSRPIFTEKALQRLAQSVGYEYQGSRTADVLRARLVDPTYEDVVESQVNEGWIATVKNHRGVEDLFVDPSLLDLRKTILPPHHEARIFLLGEHAYVWKGGTSIHVEVEQMKLVPGLDDSAIPLVGWFHPSTGQLMSVVVSDYSKRTRWHHKGEVKDAIQNHPWVMRVSRGGTGLVHISYYDDAIVGDWTEIQDPQPDLTEAVPPEEDHKLADTPRREWVPEYKAGGDIHAHVAREQQWNRAVEWALFTGRLTTEQARRNGYHFSFFEEKNLQPLPKRLYHTTTARSAVLKQGLRTRKELDGVHRGLGGGPDDLISLTDDADTAYTIARTLLEAIDVLRDEKGDAIERLIHMAEHGKSNGVSRPFLDDIWRFISGRSEGEGTEPASLRYGRRWLKIIDNPMAGFYEQDGQIVRAGGSRDPSVTTLPDGSVVVTELGQWKDGQGRMRYTHAAVPMSEGERREYRWQILRYFLAARKHAGGQDDPLFFLTDPAQLARVDPREVAVLEYEPADPAYKGLRLHALGEWRIPDQSLIRLVSDHSGDRLDPAHTDIGRRLRESAIEERRTDKARLRTLNAVVDDLVSKVKQGIADLHGAPAVRVADAKDNTLGYAYRVWVEDKRVPRLKTVNIVADAWDAKVHAFGDAGGWFSPHDGALFIRLNTASSASDLWDLVDTYIKDSRFERKLRSILRHEITHAVDPWTANPKRKPQRAADGLDSYYNSDIEVHAYTTQALADELDHVRTLAKEFAAAVRDENPFVAQLRVNDLGVLARTNWKFPLWFQAILARYPSFGRAFTHMGEQERRRTQKRFYAAWLRLRRTLLRVYRAWERVLAVDRAKAKKDWEDTPADARVGFEGEKDYLDFVSPAAEPLPDDAHPKGWRISERYAGAEKDRRLYYHAAPAWALQRILSYGLLAKPPVRGQHSTASEHGDDLTSYGGVYFGNTPAVALNAGSANAGGNILLVVVSATLRDQVADEDDITYNIVRATPKMRASLTPGLLAMGVPLVLPDEIKQREKKRFDDAVDKVTFHLTSAGDGSEAYTRRIRELVTDALRASFARSAIYYAHSLRGNAANHSLAYELSAAEDDVYFTEDWWRALLKHNSEVAPGANTQQVEQRLAPYRGNHRLATNELLVHGATTRARSAYRAAIDRLTRALRRPRTAPAMSARVLRDVRWHGNTRIVAVLLQDRDGKHGKHHHWYLVGGKPPEEVVEALASRIPADQQFIVPATRQEIARMAELELRTRSVEDTPIARRRNPTPEHADFDSPVR
ncbi:MAG: hypothetical protein IPH13_20130 [Planctomycetes bacterium]|nr:hypothetical protein [Planctomycetota bacterium]